MATTKEAGPKKKKSTSAPASPPKLQESHRRSRTVPDAYHADISKRITEQPTPHYLKPTISSCHDTNCHYPKHQQGSKPSASDPAAGRRVTVRKPTVDKALSPTSASKKTAASAMSYKERAAKTIASSSAGKTTSAPTRSKLDKAAVSKTCTGAKTLPLRKTKSLPKLNRKSKEPVNGADTVTGSVKAMELAALSPIGVVSEPEIVDAHHSQTSEVKDNENKQDGEKEEEVDGDKVAAELLQFKEPERSVAEAIAKVEAKNLVYKKQDGSSGGRKESPPAYNAVIEEAANKLGYRRNKVRALAGAFETVISLQKPESSSGHHQEEGTSGDGGRKDEHQEQQELKNREDDQGEADSTLRESEEGQESQWGTKSKDGQGDVEKREHEAAVNVDNKSTEESITENPNEQE